MSKNLQTPTKLTEFAPLQAEEKQQSVGQFISKFFKISKTSPNGDQAAYISDKDTEIVSQESLPSWASEAASPTTRLGKEPYYQVDVTEGRSLPNVLKRISNLLALKSSNLQAYSDTDLKQYWMPDSVSKECYECSEKFTTFRRRHHCRVCGQIFCSQCCNQQIPGKIFGCTGDLRVCTYCCKIALSYHDDGTELTADLKALQESLQNKYGRLSPSGTPSTSNQHSLHVASSNSEASGTVRRKISLGYQEEKFALERSASGNYLSPEEKCKVLQSSVSLRNLYDELTRPTTGVPLQAHKYRLRTYTKCFLGSELVDWLIYQQKANTRVQAAAICQALLEGSYVECLSEPCSFVDGYALYKPGLVSSDVSLTTHLDETSTQDDPIWVQQIPLESSTTDSETEELSAVPRPLQSRLAASSSFVLDLNLEANTVYLSKPSLSSQNLLTPDDLGIEKHNIVCEEAPAVKTSEQRELVPESGWHKPSHLRDENGEKLTYDLLTDAFKNHQQNFIQQLLSVHGLSASWSKVIVPLVQEVVDCIRPDKNHDAEDLDIRQYVQLKKVPGGTRSDSQLIKGVVCSKNIAHKGMCKQLDNPKILLLQCSVVYQRTEGRLMSLEPILMQESEYLKQIVARIVALQPDVILVQRNVSRLAQDLLRKQGMTLVLNVKQSILERLGRSTQADLVTSMDAHIGRPRLGTCKSFYLKTFNIDHGGSKTLMFFEGLQSSYLCGTVLLRGASKAELGKVKNVVSFFLFCCYSWRLEKSFLMDEFAQPPNARDEFFDDSKENSPDIPKQKHFCDEEAVERFSNNSNKATEIFFDCETDTEVFSNISVEKDTHVNENKKHKEKEDAEHKTTIDFKDPLLSYSVDDDLFIHKTREKFAVAELPFSNVFRKALDDTILCISPYLVFSIPYLETESARKCKLRRFFPAEIYLSSQFSTNKNIKNSKQKVVQDLHTEGENVKNIEPVHPFVTAKLRWSADSYEVQSMLAHFRACGGRYKSEQNVLTDQSEKENQITSSLKTEPNHNQLDALDPKNHQKLAVLFCSFSHMSNNAPAFCVNPWVVYMDFYGVNDIPLGCFLERYCFRASYNCASKTCDTPMVKHIRRFVHNGGCLSISLNSFENDFKEENIVMWSWCSKCQTVSPAVPMSADSWSFSFAKYLELRFHGSIYGRRGSPGCRHSLHHDHYQYFGYKDVVASFKYTTIKMWEISLPPSLITINYDIGSQHDEMIDEAKRIALSGHEIFSLISEKLLSIPADTEGLINLKQIMTKEQAAFKQRIEEIQLKLTSPTVDSKQVNFEDPKKDIQAAMWRIGDSLVRVKRLIFDTVEQWNTRLADSAKKKDADKKKDKTLSVELESPSSGEAHPALCDIVDNRSPNNESNSSLGTAKTARSLDQPEGSDEMSLLSSHARPHSQSSANEDLQDKRESDKKTVKNLFSQFLPSASVFTPIQSPFSQQEHFSLPADGTMPVVVYEIESSSVVAYALNSYEYKRAFDEISGKKLPCAEQTPSPVHKRKMHLDKERNESGEFSVSAEKSTGILSFLRNRESKNDLLSVTPTSATSDVGQIDEQNSPAEKIEDVKKAKPIHIEVQFQDHSCNFFCRVYFAEQFAWLRSLVFVDGEEAYIRSLSRCVPWNARGGKSGSTFCKTKDDRFILKELPKSELQPFFDSAAHYFSYMQTCISSGQPTLLGKILGIYQIIFRNQITNVTLRTNLLVMENLFYNKVVTHKFDLKGSMRNRLVNPDNQDGEIVLLDENLLKMTCDAPLYILPHSKAVLMAAIHNDTEFLSAQSVMDYSLLVGLDSDNKELVLGIIDYIRTFTWDKKLETMVKKSGILGGQGKLPTIISPEEYRKRFIEAMHRYFLEVPDHWVGLGKGLEF